MRKVFKIRRIITMYSLLLSLGFLSATCAYAGVGVTPENMEMVVKQGSVTKGEYVVVNDSDEATRVKVEAEDWFKSRLGRVGPPVNEWLKVEPMEFDLGPKESKKIAYSIIPPEGQEGELAAMIFFSTTAPNGAFNITSRFGVSIYAAIENNIKLECAIKSAEVYRIMSDPEKNPDQPDSDITFYMEIENTGNVHLRPTGNIEITGPDGSVYNATIERGFPVYQGKNLKSSVAWKKTDVAPGDYKANIVLDYGALYKMDKKLEKNIAFTVNADGAVATL